jgi:hypothetical protein
MKAAAEFQKQKNPELWKKIAKLSLVCSTMIRFLAFLLPASQFTPFPVYTLYFSPGTQKTGDKAGAIEAMKKVISIDPKDTDTHMKVWPSLSLVCRPPSSLLLLLLLFPATSSFLPSLLPSYI